VIAKRRDIDLWIMPVKGRATPPIVVMRSDPGLPRFFTHAQALAAGLTRHQITQRAAAGRWRRLRRGVFCENATWQASSPEARAVLLAHAVVLAHRSDAPFAVSHASAAAVHGLPVPLDLHETVWLTVGTGRGSRTHYDDVLRQEVASLPADHICSVGGLPVTTRARTVADCLRHLPMLDAVAIADAALHSALVRPEALSRMLQWQCTWPLAAAGRAAGALVDGRRESALESRSAVVMHHHAIPTPLTQVDIRDAHGYFVGRADFLWPKAGVVGEADGRSKYRRADAVAAFEAEKDRQAALEALGLVVVRWGARHLAGDPPAMVVRLRAALAAGDGRRFTGSLARALPPYSP
jgi:very-short-patch-repair endonuclease